MTPTETPFRFHDELLLSASDRDFAATRYKQVFFALDHPELRAVFERIDRQARAAKAKSRRLGLAALGLAAASLLAFPLKPAARRLERAATEEMLDVLSVNDRARFVL